MSEGRLEAGRLLTEGDRGIGNGIQVGGNYLGSVVGGGLAAIVYDRWGWVPAILMLALLTATALGVVIGFREPQREVQREVQMRRAGMREVLSVFG